MNTLISHELPKQLFPYHRYVCDYPYVLGHLLLKGSEHYDEDYAQFHKQTIKEYDYSVMDNGLYELGDSIDYVQLYELGEEYKPSHLILPDCLNKKDITMDRAMKYLSEFGRSSTPNFMGVIQGQTLEELIKMIDFYNSIDKVDVIAVPLMSLPKGSKDIADLEYNLHRLFVMSTILHYAKKPLHLLGCLTPNEFLFYNKEQYKQIKSIDTSAPIMYGLDNVKFTPEGINSKTSKPKMKLVNAMNNKFNSNQEILIAHNIRTFRSFIK